MNENKRNVIITGAANGVGKAVAKLLKNERLILIDIDEENLNKVSVELGCSSYLCDLTNNNRIDELVE